MSKTKHGGFAGIPHKDAAERSCEEEGCDTLLSRYNDFDFCSLHAPMFVPRMRGKVL